jgi:hypothetical protein
MREPDRLTRLADAEFGDLEWTIDGWAGRVDFNGRVVRLELDPDRKQPSREDQLAVIEPSRRFLAEVRDAEPSLRREAVGQIADAVGEQQSATELPREQFENSLALEMVSLHGSGGALHYRSDEFFPGQVITVFFGADLSDVEASVYEA